VVIPPRPFDIRLGRNNGDALFGTHELPHDVRRVSLVHHDASAARQGRCGKDTESFLVVARLSGRERKSKGIRGVCADEMDLRGQLAA